MAFVVSASGSGKKFPPPAEGVQQFVISEVKDLGMEPVPADILARNKADAVKKGQDPNKVKTEVHKVRIRYVNAAGESVIEKFTASLHERSKLRPRVAQIIGKDPGDKYDIDTLVGRQVQAVISHVVKGDNTYANIAAIMKPAPGQAVVPPQTGNFTGPVTATNPITDADIPF
jgi:hypothetical protein